MLESAQAGQIEMIHVRVREQDEIGSWNRGERESGRGEAFQAER